MTTAELVYERVKLLPEPQVLRVLDFVEHLPAPPLTAGELRRLPKTERQRLLAAQATGAEALYAGQPELAQDCVDAPLDYDTTGTR